MIKRDRTVVQSAHSFNPEDGRYNRMPSPVLGIVLNVYQADSVTNRSAALVPSQRGNRCEAKVLVINDGSDTPWILPNVVVTPPSSSGADNYSEEIPRPCSFMLNGGQFDTSFAGVNTDQLNGDFCVVDFIGGSITQPFMVKWWPHPGNKEDPATIGDAPGKTVNQSQRLFKRYQGAKFTITSTGSLFIDTSESGSQIIGARGGSKRVLKETGGDVYLTVKQNRKFEVNFNPPVASSTEPSVSPPVGFDGSFGGNPPRTDITREDIVTRLTADQNFIEAIAGQIVKIIGRQGDNSIELGDSPDDYVTKGQLHKIMHQALADHINQVNDFVKSHDHPIVNAQNAAPGPVLVLATSSSGPGDAPTMPDSNISTVVRVK